VHRKTIAITLFQAAFLVAAAIAPAAEAPTRDEYVAGLEKICKPDAEATQRAMKGARVDIKAERFDAAAKKFAKATTIFGGNVEEISAEPRPAADTERLSKWFTYLKRQEDYLGQITVQLRQDHPTKALRLIQRFIHTGNQANNVVLAFGFNWCSFEFSRYG
jgi:hypothetical protein